jgi:hypothetical protein
MIANIASVLRTYFLFLEYISLPKLINISILSKSFPRLVSLWTSRCGLHPDENLAELIISLVTYFEELVEIIINKGSTYRRDGVRGRDILLIQQKSINNWLVFNCSVFYHECSVNFLSHV